MKISSNIIKETTPDFDDIKQKKYIRKKSEIRILRIQNGGLFY